MAKVAKMPIDQLISGAVKQYIDYVKTDSDNQTDDRVLTSDTQQNDSSEEEHYKTEDTTLQGTTAPITVLGN